MARIKDKAAVSTQQSANTNSHTQNTETLEPVKAHIYRALAELNGGFEKVIQDLKTLQQVSFLRSERLSDMHDLICGIRAEANHECLGILNDREAVNAGHFGGLRRGREHKPREIAAG
jgi:hypothetical protein